MIKKAYSLLFTKPTNIDQLKVLWNNTRQKLGKKVNIISIESLPVTEIQTVNNPTILEVETNKSQQTFQQILANSQ
jgi:hypothetical protein